jgi:hypothetical protein
MTCAELVGVELPAWTPGGGSRLDQTSRLQSCPIRDRTVTTDRGTITKGNRLGQLPWKKSAKRVAPKPSVASNNDEK